MIDSLLAIANRVNDKLYVIRVEEEVARDCLHALFVVNGNSIVRRHPSKTHFGDQRPLQIAMGEDEHLNHFKDIKAKSLWAWYRFQTVIVVGFASLPLLELAQTVYYTPCRIYLSTRGS